MSVEVENMKILIFRTMIISTFISLFVFLIGQQQVQAQQGKPLNLNDIQKTFISTSHISKTIEELNEQLITDIRKRKVNFILTSEDEDSLKKAGGSDLLIKEIRENLPERTKEKIILYQEYLNNYDKKTVPEIKIAVKAAKEYVKKFSDDKDDKEIIDYFKAAIPNLEKNIADLEKVVKYPIIN